MGILDNLENAWNDNFEFESKPMPVNDSMGREMFWEDLGRPTEDTSLAVKIFSDLCCSECSCESEAEDTKEA